MRICAECLDFMECGDWDICCRKQVRRLTYEYCEACERFEEGREISPVIVAKHDGADKAFKPNGEATLDDCVSKAKELVEEGYEDVRVVDDRPDQLYPLLWMERKC